MSFLIPSRKLHITLLFHFEPKNILCSKPKLGSPLVLGVNKSHKNINEALSKIQKWHQFIYNISSKIQKQHQFIHNVYRKAWLNIIKQNAERHIKIKKKYESEKKIKNK